LIHHEATNIVIVVKELLFVSFDIV